MMRKMITSKYFRRKKAMLAKKLSQVTKDLKKLSNHIKKL